MRGLLLNVKWEGYKVNKLNKSQFIHSNIIKFNWAY
jgi:hypothetical protein